MSHSSDSAAPALTRSRSVATRKMILTAMFACLAFVLNTFVYFPAMAPFQHFVDVLAAVFVGPWYAFAAASFVRHPADAQRPDHPCGGRRHLRSHPGRPSVPEIPQFLGGSAG